MVPQWIFVCLFSATLLLLVLAMEYCAGWIDIWVCKTLTNDNKFILCYLLDRLISTISSIHWAKFREFASLTFYLIMKSFLLSLSVAYAESYVIQIRTKMGLILCWLTLFIPCFDRKRGGCQFHYTTDLFYLFYSIFVNRRVLFRCRFLEGKQLYWCLLVSMGEPFTLVNIFFFSSETYLVFT